MARKWILDLITRPPKAPLVQLAVYFSTLAVVVALLVEFVPAVGNVIAGSGPEPAGADLRDLLAERGGGRGDFLAFDLRMLIVMTGTFFITVPLSWSYMTVRERTGYEQSVVQTLVILPIVVAAIMMVIQNSLALAFALGGVAAAVRFRNTLKDVADATYVFLALGLGIAAGTGAWTAAFVMSAMFTFISVVLWRCNHGFCGVQADAAEHEGPGSTETGKPFRGRMLIEVRGDQARTALEAVLPSFAKRWKLRRAMPGEAGATLLHYDIRLKRSASPQTLSAELASGADAGVGSARFVPRAAGARRSAFASA